MGRRSSAADLDRELAECEADRGTLDGELAAERARRAGEAERLTQLQERLRVAAAERSTAAGALDAARARLEELLRARALSERECEGLAREREEVGADLEAARVREAEVSALYEAARQELGELEDERKALEAERGQRTRDEGEARVEATELSERRDALRQRRQDLEHASRELRDEIERTARVAREHRASADHGAEEGERLLRERDEHLAARGRVEERAMELRAAEAEGREAIDELRRRCEALTDELEGAMDRVSERRLEKQRLELAQDEVARRAEEDFGRTAAQLLERFEPEEELSDGDAVAALEAQVEDLKRSMDKLGPVNVEAVEELEEVAGRLSFLTTQRADLHEARRALEGTLKKLNDESERRFVESFEQIREHFRTLFRQLFGGGPRRAQPARGRERARGGHRDHRAPAGSRVASDHAPVRGPTDADRAGAPVRRLPDEHEPVLRAGRGRRRAGRREHRAVPVDDPARRRPHAVHHRDAQQGGPCRRARCSTA